MIYRPDIDGLRAVAVMSVVLFHAGFPLFSGGFVGVDVFFVISGFLITTIIADDLAADRFSLRNFYERRIRRIIPALYLVCFASTVAAVMIMLPEHLEQFARSLAATVIFVSNILFWSQSGYFDGAADLKPLLHTWSLAVEEQFYLFFPIVMMVTARYLRKNYIPVIVLLAVGSFAISIWGVAEKPSATFYWAPTRAWELLIGALLALGAFPAASNRAVRDALGIIGLVMIVYAVFSYDYSTAFPGLNALLPCLGAALLIYAGQSGGNMASRVLAWRPLVGVGLCSYSFYLWHWPVLVFAGYLRPDIESHYFSAGLVALSFALSVLSWKFVETPFRNREFLNGGPAIFIAMLSASCVLIALGGTILLKQGMPERFAGYERLEALKKNHVNSDCVDIPAAELAGRVCTFGDSSLPDDPRIIVWGDSHAGVIFPAFEAYGETQRRSVMLASFSGCPPLTGVRLARSDDSEVCRRAGDAVLELVRPGDTVVLVARWSYYSHRSLINGEGPVWLGDDESRLISEQENLAVIRRSIERTLAAISGRGGNVVILGSVPEFPRSVPEMQYFRKGEIIIDRRKFQDNRRQVNELLSTTAESGGALYVDPAPALCDAAICRGTSGEHVYYIDDDHLSRDGAMLLMPVLLEKRL